MANPVFVVHEMYVYDDYKRPEARAKPVAAHATIDAARRDACKRWAEKIVKDHGDPDEDDAEGSEQDPDEDDAEGSEQDAEESDDEHEVAQRAARRRAKEILDASVASWGVVLEELENLHDTLNGTGADCVRGSGTTYSVHTLRVEGAEDNPTAKKARAS
jgi:hypothetical protein